MKLPSSERNDIVMQTVSYFFIKEDIFDFPIDPKAIIKANKWGLITYTEIAEENYLSIDEVIEACQSIDGYIIRDGYNYTIAYNDTIKTPGRIRFTLMHEIGHIYLNHLLDFDETIMLRSKLTMKSYKILENEAHAFARNTLAPAKLVTDLKDFNKDKINIGDLMYHFRISQSAAKTRLQFLIADLVHHTLHASPPPNQFKEYVYKSIHSKFCNKCNCSFVHESAIFCPICGSKNLSKRKGVNIMIYSGHILNDNGLPLTCPRCENEEIHWGDFCKICGLQLINICTNVNYDRDGDLEWQCRTITKGIRAEGNARHCVECGHETTYAVNKLLEPWKIEKDRRELELSDDDLPDFLKRTEM